MWAFQFNTKFGIALQSRSLLRVANLATHSQAAMHGEASANGCPVLLFLADGPFAVFAGEADDFLKWLPFSLTTAEVWTTMQIMVKRLLEQYKQ